MPAGISKIFFVILLVFIPSVSYAQVIVNEVQVAPTGEKFLELYNAGSSSVDLTGWSIKRKTSSGTESTLVVPSRLQGKSISATGYFLIANETGYTGSGILDAGWPPSNTGVAANNTVILLDANNSVVDKVGWGEAGDCPNPCPPNPPSGQSIQRVVSGWIAASPTPRAINSSTGVSTSTPTDQTVTTPATTTQTTSTNTPNTESTTLSTHYGSVGLSFAKPISKFEVGAGRDRLSTVGTPIEFKAETNKETTRRMAFTWNFGDGSIGNGEVVTHAYNHPGEYVVVLNASDYEGQAVSRTNVKIITPELSVSTALPDGVEVVNGSKNEVNLFGRALVWGNSVWSFPQDTIVKAGQKIIFPSSVTGIHPIGPREVFLVVVDRGNGQNTIPIAVEKARQERLVSLQKELIVLQSRLAAMRSAPVVVEPSAEPVLEEKPEAGSAAVFSAVEPERGSKWFGVFKRFFLGTSK